MGEVGGLVSGASAIGNLAGGGKGGGGQQYPYFQSPGGVTPEQQALAEYTMGQDMVQQGSQFANTGTGMSTMATQAGAVGPAFTEAASLAQSSDANQQAMMKAQQVGEQINNQNITNQSNQLSQLSNLAKQLTGSQTQAGFSNTVSQGLSNLG